MEILFEGKMKQTLNYMKAILLLATYLFISCSSDSHDNKVNEQDQIVEFKEEVQPSIEFINPQEYSFEDISKYAISSLMSQDPINMNVYTEGENFIISYIKDSKLYSYKIKFDQNQIMWGNLDGRWRDHELDEKLFYKEVDDKLQITMQFSDGTNSTKEYHK